MVMSNLVLISISALEATQTDNIVVGKSYETLQYQMWTLLPGFCNKPTDLAQVRWWSPFV
jgi:hypothetical protein